MTLSYVKNKMVSQVNKFIKKIAIPSDERNENRRIEYILCYYIILSVVIFRCSHDRSNFSLYYF